METPFLNTYMSMREQKSLAMDLKETEAWNDCAGKDQQQSKPQGGGGRKAS
jgi:hypothetical protein